MEIERLLLSAGAMKAGTSWLYKQVEQHSQIEVVPIKEIHYFAHVHSSIGFLDGPGRIHNFRLFATGCEDWADLKRVARASKFFARYLKDPVDDRWYKSLFLDEGKPVKADFSNMACVLDGYALDHMRKVARSIRVVYTLRDPLVRLWSHVKFHASLMNEIDLINGLNKDGFRDYFVGSGAATQSDYSANIGRMKSRFGPEELHVAYFDDMLASPQRALNQIFDFVGVSPMRISPDAINARVNEGPILEPPPAFLQAANELLEPQYEALEQAGIAIHEAWTRRLRADEPSSYAA